jgi:nucleotide-binding universal stress UspA family protein
MTGGIRLAVHDTLTIGTAPGSEGSMISTIAVGTDGTSTANEAVREAAEIADRFGAKLVLLSVFEDSGAGQPHEDVELEWVSHPQTRVRTILERLEGNLKRSGLDCVTLADSGDPAKVLVRLAEECGADLLVIGNRGMSRRVLGSVPNTVTHTAHCSVLVVKTT